MGEQDYFFRDTWAEIDLDCISENVTRIKELLPQEVEMIAVVKANAYGHGDVQVAETALEAGASYLAVAFLDEAIALREKGLKAPILVLGASRAKDVHTAVKHQVTLTVFQEDWLREALDYLQEDEQLKVHIKVDTGMGRIGVRCKEELKTIEQILRQDKRFELEGIFTHFATADELDLTYFQKQFDLFQEMLAVLSCKPRYIHCSNSAAALRFPQTYFNAIRLGISMYGLTPSPEMKKEIPVPLKEAFSLRSRLVHVKKLSKGEKVSYGATFESDEGDWIGTIPIGYADGWIRKLQGIEVLAAGKRAQVVGRICMDQCMVRLPFELPIGTTVTLIGKDADQFVSINDIAEKLDTINYEVPCIVASRVPRLFKKGGKIISTNNAIL